MKKKDVYKRFIFVPVTCFVMFILMSGYIVLGELEFWQRPETDALRLNSNAAADTETEVFKSIKAAQKVSGGDVPIDINKASVEELMRLPGIGAVKARTIVSQRIKMKGFYSVDDLVCTDGIGTKTLENLREFIIISEYEGE